MRIVLDTNPSNLLSYPHAETESKTHPQTNPRLLTTLQQYDQHNATHEG